jgi:signal transduction histidine kinase
MQIRLSTRFTFTYFLISTALFAVSAVVLYTYLRKEVDEKVEWRLQADRDRIVDARSKCDSLAGEVSIYQMADMISHRYIEIKEVCASHPMTEEIKDTLLPTFLFGMISNRPYKQMKFYTSIDDLNYEIILRQQLVETTDLREGIVNSLLYVLVFLLVVLVVTNYLISRSIWRPFYKTIDSISNYKLAGEQVLALPGTTTREFRTLNDSVDKMARKIRKDFLNLKEFTENMSHEIQTPLAVITSKLELLMQSEHLNAEFSEYIDSMYDAVRKLSRLNQSLILIAKIENAQFREKRPVPLGERIDHILGNFEDLAEARELKINQDIEPGTVIEMDLTLADVLLSNLISNAVKYSNQKSEISIYARDRELRISNYGKPHEGDTSRFFERFRKDQTSRGSLGLGLSIVKSICDFYQMKVDYRTDNGLHELIIRF